MSLKPDQIQDGMRVRYWPSRDSDLCYLGTVRGEPRRLGDAWVVTLDEMSSFNGGRRKRESAADIDHMALPSWGAVSP